MSYFKITNLSCDGEGCLEITDEACWTASEAREYSRPDGWRYREGKDYCPDCA